MTLSGHGLMARILTLGGILQDLRLHGVDYGLTLGSDRLADYEGPMQYHGGIVGPVANRITGARAPIDGVPHTFDANLGGLHTLHSGSAGTHQKVWDIVFEDPEKLVLSTRLPPLEAGFPASRTVTATFELERGPALRLTLKTTSDAPSLVNMTNHSYWNLDGSDTLAGHKVRVAAPDVVVTDGEFGLPTGEIGPVAGSPLDFRQAVTLAPGAPPLDTTFCVSRKRRPLTECMWLTGKSDVSMSVATTEPGMHLYDGRAAQRPGRPTYEGIAVEAQGWPDAPNHAGFPSIEITPDAPVLQITQWRFCAP